MAGAALESSNANLDGKFEPRGSTTKHADVGLQTNGVDISNRYMDVAQGGTATAAATGLETNGVDINTIFAKLGTAAAGLNWAATLTNVTHQNAAGGNSSASVTFNTDGSLSHVGNVSGDALPTNYLDSAAAGNGDLYEIQYSKVSGTTFTGLTAGGAYVPLSSVRSISLSSSGGGGVISGRGTIRIREIANTGTIEIRDVFLSADSVNQGGGIFL